MIAQLALVAAAAVGAPLQSDSLAPRPIAEWVHTKWLVKDGAPAGISALAQTGDGYVWIGTRTGLLRFDGVRFVDFTPKGVGSMPVLALRTTHDGVLWIVWSSGRVSRLLDGKLTTYDERQGLSRAFVLAESPHGALIAGTATGLSRFVDGKWVDAGPAWQYPGRETKALWFDHEGTLWAQTEDRVVYLPDGADRFVDPGMRLKRTANHAEFGEAKDGSVWMAEVYRSVHSLPRAGDQRPLSEVLVGALTMLIDRKGSLWIGTYGDGLRRVLDPTTIGGRQIARLGKEAEEFTVANGLQSNLITTLFEDRDGGIWLGSERGLERFHEGAIRTLGTPGTTQARSVFALRDSSVWILDGGLPQHLRVTPRGIDTITAILGTMNLFEDTTGAIWNVNGDRLSQYVGHSLQRMRLRTDTSWFFDDVLTDRAGITWVYDEGTGLLRLEKDSLVRAGGFSGARTSGGKLFLDRAGRIWIRADRRAAVFEKGAFREIDLPHDGGLSTLFGFTEDRAGAVWAYGSRGLHKLDESRLRLLTGQQGVAAGRIFGAVIDDEGAWWLATPSGVARIAGADVDRAFADSAYAPRARIFDASDGLPGLILPSWRSLARAADGTLWIGTDSAVGRLDPGRLPVVRTPRPVIEAVRVDGRESLPRALTVIEPRNHDVEVDYTVTEFSAPERLRFRYQLDGAEPAWHEVGGRRRAYFTNLSPGTYHFRVAAATIDGDWNESATAWTFRVLPAWYQTLWLRGLVVLLIGGAFAAIAVLVQRRRHQSAQLALKAQYEATLAERGRIAQDLHDTLLQGFIGVTLQLKATERALPPNADAAARSLTQVQQLARDSLREARERVWDMRDSSLSTDNVAEALEALARERTSDTGIAVKLIVTGERRRLPAAVENAAFRIGREAIANAVRHASPTRVELHVNFGDTALELQIHDDGRGFTPEEGEQARREGHFGLTGARERAVRMGGRCDVYRRDGGGTVVALVLPMS